MNSRRKDALRRTMARMSGLPDPDAALRLTSAQERKIALWASHPWEFLTGTDIDNKTPIYQTKDEKDRVRPIKAFPGHLEYIKVWISLLADPTEGFILADKCRQMYLTTATLAYMLWECMFLPGRRWLLSKSTEDESKDLIRDKIRFPVSIMPQWVRDHFGIEDKPELRVPVKLTGSYILGVAQNVAERDARGGTASGMLVDEAAFQDNLGGIITAARPMTNKIILITTPNIGGGGAHVFKSYKDDEMIADYVTGEIVTGKPRSEIAALIDKAIGEEFAAPAAKKVTPVKGMSVHKTRRGVCVVGLDWYADPTRDERWLAKMRSDMPNESAFQSEILRNWDVSPGIAFYTEFQSRPQWYVRTLPRLINQPVYRGWDFGGHNPVCIWLQYSPKSGRVWIVREFTPQGLDIYSHRDLVLYLSGQKPRDFLSKRPNAMKWLEQLERDSSTPDMLRVTPWFTSHPTDPIEYIDYAGHEANQGIGREAGNQSIEFTRQQILATEGIHLNVHYTTTKAKTDIFRRLMQPWPDGQPGIFIDPLCRTLIRGFAGGIVRAKATPDDPDPVGPAKDAVYSHVHEAAGYVVVNAVPLDLIQKRPDPRVVGYSDSREPIYDTDDADLIFDAGDDVARLREMD